VGVSVPCCVKNNEDDDDDDAAGHSSAATGSEVVTTVTPLLLLLFASSSPPSNADRRSGLNPAIITASRVLAFKIASTSISASLASLETEKAAD